MALLLPGGNKDGRYLLSVMWSSGKWRLIKNGHVYLCFQLQCQKRFRCCRKRGWFFQTMPQSRLLDHVWVLYSNCCSLILVTIWRNKMPIVSYIVYVSGFYGFLFMLLSTVIKWWDTGVGFLVLNLHLLYFSCTIINTVFKNI